MREIRLSARDYHTAFHLVNAFSSILNSENGGEKCCVRTQEHKTSHELYAEQTYRHDSEL